MPRMSSEHEPLPLFGVVEVEVHVSVLLTVFVQVVTVFRKCPASMVRWISPAENANSDLLCGLSFEASFFRTNVAFMS